MALAAVLSFLRRLLVCPSAALPSASLSLSRAPSFFRSHRAPAPGCTFAFKLHAIHPHTLARSLGGGGGGIPGAGRTGDTRGRLGPVREGRFFHAPLAVARVLVKNTAPPIEARARALGDGLGLGLGLGL